MKTEASLNIQLDSTAKQYMGFIAESWRQDMANLQTLLRKAPKGKHAAIARLWVDNLKYSPLRGQLYLSFVERQDDPNPNSLLNVLRFIRHMEITAEFQTRV